MFSNLYASSLMTMSVTEAAAVSLATVSPDVSAIVFTDVVISVVAPGIVSFSVSMVVIAVDSRGRDDDTDVGNAEGEVDNTDEGSVDDGDGEDVNDEKDIHTGNLLLNSRRKSTTTIAVKTIIRCF